MDEGCIMTAGEHPIDAVRAVLYGPPKVGKTGFLSTVPNMLIGDVDGGVINCSIARKHKAAYFPIRPGVKRGKVTAATYHDALNMYLDELAENAQWTAGSVDTVGQLSYFLLDEIEADLLAKGLSQKDIGYKMYSTLVSTIRKFIAAVSEIPKHFLLVGHTTLEKDAVSDSFVGALDCAGRKGERFIERLFDDLWLMLPVTEQDDKTNDVQRRYIYTTNKGYWTGGSRLGLPPILGPDPTWATVMDALGAFQEQPKSTSRPKGRKT